jgi:hypothetical protein
VEACGTVVEAKGRNPQSRDGSGKSSRGFGNKPGQQSEQYRTQKCTNSFAERIGARETGGTLTNMREK